MFCSVAFSIPCPALLELGRSILESIVEGQAFNRLVRNISLRPISMKKRTVRKRRQSSIEMDEPAKLEGLTSGVHRRRKKTRKDIDQSDELRKKKQSMGMDTVEGVEPIDRISELPDSMIHHILSFLRSAKEAARTSVLSKRWREAWKSLSVLTFDERSLRTEGNVNRGEQIIMFFNLIDKSLQSHLDRNLSIHKLVFRVTAVMAHCLNHVITVAMQNGLKELDLQVIDVRHRLNFLRPLLCSAATLTGVTALRMHGFNWGNFADLKFCNLQKLYLRCLYIEHQMITNLISNCPSIMDLRIIDCEGLKILQLPSSLKLERVELHHCRGLRNIKIEAVTLQTFWYRSKKSTRCEINLESCKSLKRLTLEDPNLTDDLLVKQLKNFPVLEKLDLSGCNKLKRVRTANLKLGSLILRSCKYLKVVDTTRLCSLDYKGNRMPLIFQGHSHLNEAKISLESKRISEAEIGSRNSYIHKLLPKYCGGFIIVVCSGKNVIVHEDSREIILPLFPDLKLHVIKSSTDSKDLLDDLLRTWHPDKLTIVSSPSSNFHKMVHEIKRGKKPSCCRYNASNNKCWRHFLKYTRILSSVEAADIPPQWRHSWEEEELSSLLLSNIVSGIRLYWKPLNILRKA